MALAAPLAAQQPDAPAVPRAVVASDALSDLRIAGELPDGRALHISFVDDVAIGGTPGGGAWVLYRATVGTGPTSDANAYAEVWSGSAEDTFPRDRTWARSRTRVGARDADVLTLGEARVLVLRLAPDRWIAAGGTGLTTADLAAIAEAVGPDRIAALPAERTLWAHPTSGFAAETLAEYWQANPVVVEAAAMPAARLAAALPEAPPGTYRTLQPVARYDGRPRRGPAGRAVLAVTELEACYTAGEAPPELEHAARALRSDAPLPVPLACVALRALPPSGADAVLDDIHASDPDGPGAASLLIRREDDPGYDTERFAGRAARRLSREQRYGRSEEVVWWVRLDSATAAVVRFLPDRAPEAAALVDLVDLAALRGAQPVRISFAAMPEVEYRATDAEAARSYPEASVTPLLGAAERSGTSVEVRGEAGGYALPVPRAWSVWSARGVGCSALAVAASAAPGPNPCTAFRSLGRREAALFAGPVNYGPEQVLRLWEDVGYVPVLGAALGRAWGFTTALASVPGADAAVAVGNGSPRGEPAVRALVLQVAGLGPFALLATAPTAREAQRLLDDAAAGLRVLPLP